MQTSKKVLIAAAIYPPDPGGPALHAKKLYDWLGEHNIDRELVVLSNFKHFSVGFKNIAYGWNLFKKANECDLIYAYDAFGSGMPAVIVSRLRKKPLIIRIGGDIPWERAAQDNQTSLSMKEWYAANKHKRDWRFWLSRLVMKDANSLIVTSHLLSELYSDAYGIDASKLHVINNPIPERRNSEDFTKPRTIIFASRLVAYKNLSLVLEVMAKILLEYRDVNFIIMGEGPERKNLEKKALELGIEKQVIFEGAVPQDEVMNKTKRAYIGIAPALTEFNPNYILQCLAYGKPFIISREQGFSFKIPEDFIFDARNKSELEERLRFLLSPEGYEKGRALLRSMEIKRDWEKVISENLEIIDNL